MTSTLSIVASQLSRRWSSSMPSMRTSLTTSRLLRQTSAQTRPCCADGCDENTHITEDATSGLKIATQQCGGGFATVGVAIDAGSRYEGPYRKGVCHFLTKLAFGPSSSFRDRSDIADLIEKGGAILDCQASHDIIMYAISCRVEKVSTMFNLIGETLKRPLFNNEELELARNALRGELEDLDMRPDPSTTLTELIHKAAFGDQSLGMSQYVSRDNVDAMRPRDLYSFMRAHYRPARMVACCVGDVDHAQFTEIVRTSLIDKEPIWSEYSSIAQDLTSDLIDTSKCEWEGNAVMVEKDLSNVSLGPTPMPELIHLCVGLKAPGYLDDDFVAACVLNSLMGGGGNFSAGGPGKGMYSRMYLRVLTMCGWAHCAETSNTPYSDCGLFVLRASSDPHSGHDMANVVVRELLHMAKDIQQEELSRAKNQLLSSVLMNLEQRPAVYEDISRQVLGLGCRRSPSDFGRRIESADIADVVRVANRMIHDTPRAAVAALGDIRKLPEPESIQRRLRPQHGILRNLFK